MTVPPPLPLKGVNLYLVGMMGAGKTTIGRLLAKHLNYRFFDTDLVVEQTTGKSVTTLFAELGESAFRQAETQVLAELSAYTRLVVATGGGIVLNSSNWSYLHHGLVIWLDVPLDELYTRVKNNPHRPLLQTPDPYQTLQQLLEHRSPLYAQADVRVAVNAGEPARQVTQRVLDQIRLAIKPASIAEHN
jgi:shikimate kinase